MKQFVVFSGDFYYPDGGLWQTYKTTPLSEIDQINIKVRFPMGVTFNGILVWPDVKEPDPDAPAPIAPAPKA